MRKLPGFGTVHWICSVIQLSHRGTCVAHRHAKRIMIEALFNQPNYLAAKQLLRATSLQHEAIANNLANVETPNYHRIQVSPTFKQELAQAVRSQDAGEIGSLALQLEEDPNAVASRLDGNNVV